MKKTMLCVLLVFISLLLINNVWGDSDNIFVGMETVAELDDLDFIAQEANLIEFEDGEITVEDLDFSRIHKIYVDTLPYFFNEEELSADEMKMLINDSNYVYYLPIYREHETVFLTIAKGLELSPDVELPNEGIEYIQERAGRWGVSEVGKSEKVLDPSTDYMGLMESYLETKDIHNAEIYFVSRINPESMINAVCFTGNKTESGKDEIIFIAVDKLEYDEYGNLIFSESEYSYDELRKMNEETNLDPEYSGGSGGNSDHNNYNLIIITIATGIILIIGIIFIVRKKT